MPNHEPNITDPEIDQLFADDFGGEPTPDPKPMPVSTPETRNDLQWQVDQLRREVEELRKVVEELPSQMAEAVSDRLHGRLA